MDDYKARRKNVDAEYARMIAIKKSDGKASVVLPVISKLEA